MNVTKFKEVQSAENLIAHSKVLYIKSFKRCIFNSP